MGPYCKYSCEMETVNHKKYRIVVMEIGGKTTLGRIYDSFEEVNNAMIELRMLYVKHEVTHHVGYVEV